MVAHTLTLADLEKESARAREKRLAEKAEQQPIVKPEIGNILHYYDAAFPHHPQPLIVAIVHNERSVTGCSFDAQGWAVPRQRIFMRHLGTEHPKPPYVQWPHFKEDKP